MYEFIKLKEEDPNKIYSIIQKIHIYNNKFELFKVKNKKSGEIFAAKIIKDNINNYSEKIKALKKFENPYIVQFYHYYTINNTIWIITEFVDCGSALDIMKITNKCFKEQEIASIIVMVLKGLQYLHLQKKYHGGIKPSNILINNEGVVKLSDYNISSQLLNFNNQNNNIKNPPELTNKNNYTIKCDIWYLGLTCLELAEGTFTFNNNNNKKNKKKNDFTNSNNLWSLEFIDFIQKCLSENPMNRPSAAVLLNHPFIINNNKGKIIIKKKINSIKTLIDIYREKIDEQEEKNNINENIELGKNSLEITSFNENLSISQSDDINNKNNNINPSIIDNKFIANNKESKEKDKKSKTKKIKISIKNTQIQNNNGIIKSNGLSKKNGDKTSSKKRSKKNMNSSLKKNKVSSFEIYEKIKNHNKIKESISNGILYPSKGHNKNLQIKRHSMINKYIKNNNYNYNNKIGKIRNDMIINSKINNTQENIYPKNNLMKLLNKFEGEKITQNKNVNKSQRLEKIENAFILTESPNTKKIKHKYNYSIKITNNKNNNITKDKRYKDNNSLSSIDSLRNSRKDKNSKNNNINNGKNFDKKIKSKTRNKKSNGGNQNLSELNDSNKYGKKPLQKKNIYLRNLILNNSGKNIINEDNMKIKDINLNEKNNNISLNKLNNSINNNNFKNLVKKEGNEYKFTEINIRDLNKSSKTPNVYYFKSGDMKRMKRPPLSHSSKKNNFSKKINQSKMKSHKINTNGLNNANINNSIHNITNISIKENDKSDYVDFVNNTNYTNINTKLDNQSFSYNRNDKVSLTEEELKLLCLNEKLNKRGLPELITELAGLENKMNHEIQKIKEQYEPIIKQNKDGIKFLKQNPFLKNIKEYENYKNFIKTMKISSNDDMDNRSISSSIHNMNKIKISFYQANDIEELNISANKYILDKTGYGHHGLIKI